MKNPVSCTGVITLNITAVSDNMKVATYTDFNIKIYNSNSFPLMSTFFSTLPQCKKKKIFLILSRRFHRNFMFIDRSLTKMSFTLFTSYSISISQANILKPNTPSSDADKTSMVTYCENCFMYI